MTRYFCSKCLGTVIELRDDILTTLSGNAYQLDKLAKHHDEPVPVAGLCSTFSDRNEYDNYVVAATQSGSLQIDSGNRKSLVWFAGKDVGVTYKDNELVGPAECVRLVKFDDPEKIHAYPCRLDEIGEAFCEGCGCSIPR